MTADVPSTEAKTAQQKSTTQEEADASKAETESQKETPKDAGKTIRAKLVWLGRRQTLYFRRRNRKEMGFFWANRRSTTTSTASH